MKREKRITKKERKALDRSSGVGQAQAAGGHQHEHAHIHCIACGAHLDPGAFGEPGGPDFYRCQHGSDFPHCAAHAAQAKSMVDEHDRTGKPVQKAAAWH